MFSVGDKIGAYEIVAELRAGGMAALFVGRRAGAAGFAKLVAIKVVHEHLAMDPLFVQMFVDEALLSARIQHPNVVHVEELLELEGRHLLIMEYVYGCSLTQLLSELGRRGRKLSPELAVHIAIKVADGLHAAHEARDEHGQYLGVVHRDVSPQNVLLAYQGNVKLIDFGVAKARGRVQETEGASIKGKFRYMSPEQAYGRELDRRSDVYALGIVLWEMLTMKRRFDGANDLAVLHAVRRPDVVAPSTHASDLPAGLDEVVLRAMAPDPSRRYQTAHAFRDALVDVMPRAVALHESVLAELLAAIMGARIVKDRSVLPSNAGVTIDLPPPESSIVERVLETMTISQADIELMESSDPSHAEVHHAETKVLGEVHAPPAPAIALETAPPARAEGVAVRPVWLALGAMAMLTLLGAFAFVISSLLIAPADGITTVIVDPPPIGASEPRVATIDAGMMPIATDQVAPSVEPSIAEVAPDPEPAVDPSPPEPEPATARQPRVERARPEPRARPTDRQAEPRARRGSSGPIANEW